MRARCSDGTSHGLVADQSRHGLVLDAEGEDEYEGADRGHSGVLVEDDDESEDGALESEIATALLPPSGHLGLVADEEDEEDGTLVLNAHAALLPPSGLVADEEVSDGGASELRTALLPHGLVAADEDEDDDQRDGSEGPPRFGLAFDDE